MIVVDTGPLVALANPNDRHHAACRAWLDGTIRGNLLIPAPVLAPLVEVTQERLGGVGGTGGTGGAGTRECRSRRHSATLTSAFGPPPPFSDGS